MNQFAILVEIQRNPAFERSWTSGQRSWRYSSWKNYVNWIEMTLDMS